MDASLRFTVTGTERVYYNYHINSNHMHSGRFFPALASLNVMLAFLTPSVHGFVVDNLAIAPSEMVDISVAGFYTGEAYAGINKLLLAGVPADGFCIDPFHFSVSSSPGYEFHSLAEAPKPPGPMGDAKAEEISKLWGMVYSPDMTADRAAGLQVAIWEIVAGNDFSISGNDFGADLMLQDLNTYSGPEAQLIAVSGPAQDYVVSQPVPETGSTIALLALAVVALGCIHRFGRRKDNGSLCGAGCSDAHDVAG
jgi:hypothetical protein